jgi:hypothetical protein
MRRLADQSGQVGPKRGTWIIWRLGTLQHRCTAMHFVAMRRSTRTAYAAVRADQAWLIGDRQVADLFGRTVCAHRSGASPPLYLPERWLQPSERLGEGENVYGQPDPDPRS